MKNFQNEKKIVLNFFKELEKCKTKDLKKIISKYVSKNFRMRCTHPFNELYGVEETAKNLWSPIKKSFSPTQRRLDIFYAGINSLNNDNDVWVSSMGHFLGIFNNNFFGIKSNHKPALLRFAEFYKVKNNKITEGAFFLDIFNFMQQLGLSVIPESTGLVCVTP